MFSLTFLAVMDWFCTVLNKSGLRLAVRQSLRKLWVMTESFLITTFPSSKNVPLHLQNPQPKLVLSDAWGISLVTPDGWRKHTLSGKECRLTWNGTDTSLCLHWKSFVGSCHLRGTRRGKVRHCHTSCCQQNPGWAHSAELWASVKSRKHSPLPNIHLLSLLNFHLTLLLQWGLL